MQKIKLSILIICIAIGGGFHNSFAKNIKLANGKEILVLPDDPIAAILDSLQSLKLFECSNYSTDTCILNTYNYSPETVPYFDALTIESRLNKLDIKSPFDLVYNESVSRYIDLYAIKKRNLVSKVLGLSHLYFNLFEEQLDKYNLPLELKYLAIVESALNPSAISRTGAAGLWQFMLPTGKMFGLEVTSYVDERRDPYKSTLAACKYLKYLYNLFGDWQMVLAAYNSGPGTVSKAIRRSGGKTTYWEIRPFLPTETQNYVPAFIAVNYVMNYSREHNLYPVTVKSNYFFADTVRLKQQVNFNQISTIIDMPIAELQFLNPSYKLNIIPFDEEGSTLCLPANKLGTFINNEQEIYNFIPPVTNTKFIEKQINQPDKITHKVKGKETITTIANLYDVSVADLKKWNRLKKNIVPKGKLLVVYKKRTEEKDITKQAITQEVVNDYAKKNDKTKQTISNDESKQIDLEFSDKNNGNEADSSISSNVDSVKEFNKLNYLVHKVQRGDTLWNIASRYKGATVEELKRINKIKSNNALKVGDKIKVPLGT